MGYAQELLDAASSFISVQPATQATLRRTISTAYYALFHLLIEDACKLWAQPDHHRGLSRQFEHKRMRDASAARTKASEAGTDLNIVSKIFVYLQQKRHEADYDLSLTVSSHDVEADLGAAQVAFRSWERVRAEPAAQDYLFSLLFRDRS